MRIFIAILVVAGLLQGLLAAIVPTNKVDEELVSGKQTTINEAAESSKAPPPKTKPTPESTGEAELTSGKPTNTPKNPGKPKTTPESTSDLPFVTSPEPTKIAPKKPLSNISKSKRRSTTTAGPTTKSSDADESVELKLAEPCDDFNCRLPDCRCSDVKLGGSIPTDKIPQLVTITFDDAITALNYEIFEELFEDIRNPDGCEASGTFYFSHEYTDYTKVHNLWAQGHELALHSITHGMGTAYWKKTTIDVLTREFGQQLEMIEHFAQIDKNDIKGMRMPHFEIPGNKSYVVAQKLGLLYDSSWPTQRFTEPALWPYTLDYKSIQDCPIGRCPDASFPGLWVNPLVNWEDVEGYKCAMVDACIHLPEDDVDELLDWMISNFNRHYLGNRAPFGVYLHSSWFQKGENYLEAFKEFIGYMNRHTDVYLVSASRVIEYMQKPVPGKPFRSCQQKREASCKATLCEVHKADTNDQRWLSVCSPCPDVYPWLDNPLGLSRPAL